MRITSGSAVPFVTGLLAASCLSIAGIGTAVAASGGAVTLGHSNQAKHVTTIVNRKGMPLSLVGKTSKPPLQVNSSRQVANLNASLLAGHTAASLVTSGSGASGNPFATAIPLSNQDHFATMVAETAELPAGTYYVTASALVRGGDSSGITCFIGPDSDADHMLAQSIDNTEDWMPESEEVVTTLTEPGLLGEYCLTGAVAGSSYNAAIAAIRVLDSVPGTVAK